MTWYNTLDVKVCSTQINKLKSRTKNGTEVTLNLSSNVIGDFNEGVSFLFKILLSNTKASRLRKAFENKWSANVKFSKTHLFKMIYSG